MSEEIIIHPIGLKELASLGYPVTDFEMARKFYGEILGLKENDHVRSGKSKLGTEQQRSFVCYAGR